MKLSTDKLETHNEMTLRLYIKLEKLGKARERSLRAQVGSLSECFLFLNADPGGNCSLGVCGDLDSERLLELSAMLSTANYTG
jgi:hypothetical protein